MLKRKIRAEVESPLADAVLRGDVRPGDSATVRYNADTRSVRVERSGEASGDRDKTQADVPAQHA
ncbi:protein of unknown function (plasmid) [Cupriavidus taiwanensis]|uniref:Uncharacterized protein n=1 Tax=Cupriavidus taiwanensis TaxID=164546 RepID=A0A9Q7UYX6_9BURK|nr:protein of unknown function [Cupriavidus taiwanensis]